MRMCHVPQSIKTRTFITRMLLLLLLAILPFAQSLGRSDRCYPGQYLPNTGFYNWAECADCPPGSYSQGGTFTTWEVNYWGTSCTPCQTGYYTPSWRSNSCPYACPAGSGCPYGSGNPVPCAMGTYSPAPAGVCLQCPAGTYASVVGSTFCKDCPIGFACPLGSISPIICPLGTYSPGKSGSCLTCPYGLFTTNSGSSSCLPCPANPHVGSATDGTCLCEAGYFAA